MCDLAIVIPAYKSAFFDKALGSLAAQTNKNFSVYVGDDYSLEDLEDITEKYKSQLDIHYTRFKNNIGAKYLVHQWDRCIQLTKDEPWLWLFSDDDIADANCVETFYRTINNDGCRFDVYRFNTRVINDKDDVIGEMPVLPFTDSSINMALEILKNNPGVCMPGQIFSRQVYEKYKGFIYTDYAQAADWATLILFSAEKGICNMKEAKINWRFGVANISGHASKNRKRMIKGHLQFLKWVLSYFSFLKTKGMPVKYNEIIHACKGNLYYVTANHYKGLSLLNTAGIFNYFYFAHNNWLKAVFDVAKLYYYNIMRGLKR